MKYSIKFNLDKKLHQIYLFFNYEGARLKYYTGCRIEPEKWDNAKQRVKENQVNSSGQTSNVINRELERIRAAITDIFEMHYLSKLKDENHQINLPELKNELKIRLGKQETKEKTLFDYFTEFINSEYSQTNGTKKQMQVTLNHFQRFRGNKTTTFQDINSDVLADFENWLRDDEVKKGRNTIHNNFKRLHRFFKYSVGKGWIKPEKNPFLGFKIISEKYGEPIYITKSERNKLLALELEDNPRLDRVRDIFILQSLIGCRVGDLVKLRLENIINDNITYIQNKGKNEKPVPVTIPLSSKAKSILCKYDLPNGKLLPFITGQKYNEYLKELFETAKITRKVVRLNPKTGIEEIVRLCDIVSSHMARRTFIGVLYENEIKDAVIGSMSGHVKGSKAFGRYYSVSERQKQDAIKNLD